MADFTIKTKEAADKYRSRIGEFLEAYKQLLSMDQEYVALGIDVNLPIDAFVDITNAEFIAGVGAVQTILATIDANKTNLYKVSDGNHR